MSELVPSQEPMLLLEYEQRWLGGVYKTRREVPVEGAPHLVVAVWERMGAAPEIPEDMCRIGSEGRVAVQMAETEAKRVRSGLAKLLQTLPESHISFAGEAMATELHRSLPTS